MSEARGVRVAAVGDLHFNGDDRELLQEVAREAEEEADILALVGDLTTHGEPAQMRGVGEVLGALSIPVVSVLGNHDFEADRAGEARDILCEHGVHVLDGEEVELEGVGFAGVKGFAGGFGRGALGAFGEPLIKAFVQEAVDEAMKLENALRRLSTPIKVALLHYAPVTGTLKGEPESILPFLGSSRLLPPIETLGADVVFHGHAHTGCLEGSTPGGVPVFNVAYPVLQACEGRRLFLWTAREAERNERGEAVASALP